MADEISSRPAEVQLRTSTARFYTQELERFMANAGDKQRTGKINREVIHGYINSRSIKSRPHALRAIRSWVRWMLRQSIYNYLSII